MPKSVNKVILVGNLGKDPEVQYTTGGTAVAKFSVATTGGYKDKEGNWQETVEWHNVIAWARLAEICSEYLNKGSKVYVEGRLQTSSWEDKKSGEKKYKTEIVINDLVMLSGNQEKPAGRGDGRTTQQKARERQPARNDRFPDYEGATQITDDDIPF